MTLLWKNLAITFGVAAMAAALAPSATAACGALTGQTATSAGLLAPRFWQAAYHPSDFTLVSDEAPAGAAIVGMWSVRFMSVGNTGIPDGTVIDFGYAQWHSDGTEIMNSGGRAPATQNFCLGVWAKTGSSTYKLNHFALSYDATTGTQNASVTIRELITLDHGGNSFAGTFTIDVYLPGGTVAVQHVAGEITGTRLTADS